MVKVFIYLSLLLPSFLLASPKGHTDLQCLTANLFFEARGEGEAGMRAVSDVVINRTKHKFFKGQNTACKVVFARKQFSWTVQHSKDLIARVLSGNLEGFKPEDIAAYQKAKKIAKQALKNVPRSTLPKSVVNFHTTEINPRWASTMKKYATIGNHVFYSHKKKGK